MHAYAGQHGMAGAPQEGLQHVLTWYGGANLLDVPVEGSLAPYIHLAVGAAPIVGFTKGRPVDPTRSMLVTSLHLSD
jgi:hypothetical protein